MSDIVIAVENLSKCYVVGHQSAQRERYAALRDVIAREARNFARKAVDFVRGHQIVQGDEVEEFWALRDVSFEVKRGEVLGIIGRNGAGKSTLLKILSRITEPTLGRVKITGRIASLLEVGTGFHSELTGRENIYLNGAILGMSRGEIRRKFDEIVAFADVEKFLDTPVKRYSSGMYVRLAFAIAANLEPEILLVDEVLAVGDAVFQAKCVGKMETVAKAEGRTVLFVSHNMSTIQHLCQRVVLLNCGRVQAEGLPSGMIARYLSDIQIARSVDLIDWPDRSGSGEARITKLEMDGGDDGQSIKIGEDLRAFIHVRFAEACVNPVFSLILHDTMGVPLLDICSQHDGLLLGKLTDDVIMEVRVPKIGLYPGRYLVSAMIVDSRCRIQFDYVRLCCAVDVHSAPGPHGELSLSDKLGKYHVQSNWRQRDRRVQTMTEKLRVDCDL
jgi:lipopolysaccharide transport system ATP-binding protein